MSIPQIKIHNAETDEVIVRDMNADELAIYNKEKADYEAMQAEIAAKAAAKTALLSRLGITEDEAALLFK